MQTYTGGVFRFMIKTKQINLTLTLITIKIFEKTINFAIVQKYFQIKYWKKKYLENAVGENAKLPDKWIKLYMETFVSFKIKLRLHWTNLWIFFPFYIILTNSSNYSKSVLM